VFFVSYAVEIFIPYQVSSCDNTYSILYGANDITNWQRVENNGNTQLYFNSIKNEGSAINNALEYAFPNIDGGFNCPDS
jgi:hypothetical protein